VDLTTLSRKAKVTSSFYQILERKRMRFKALASLILAFLINGPIIADTVRVINKHFESVHITLIGKRGTVAMGTISGLDEENISVYETIWEVEFLGEYYNGHGIGDGLYIINEDLTLTIKRI
jgi:hypothetical protein